MVEPVSALSSHNAPGRNGEPADAGVTLSEVLVRSFYQYAGWPETLGKIGAVAAGAAGVAKTKIPASGQMAVGKKAILLRVEPLKWWVVSENTEISAPADMNAEEGCHLDLSHSRTWVRVNGPNATQLLNRFLPLDLRPGQFPQGAVASSAIHHIGVTLWLDEAGYNLLLPRSFAASLWEMLNESALQFGSA